MLATALFVSVSTSTLAATQDQLFLKNGDRLTGEITDYSNNIITIQTGFGLLQVDSRNIGGVASATYNMSDFQSTAAVEPLTPAPQTVPPVIVSSAPVETEIAAIEPAAGLNNDDEAPGLWGARWSGNANLGGELETGNSDSKNFSVDAETQANWEDIHRMTLAADYDWEQENDEKVTDEREASGIYDYFFADKWFWNNSVMWEQDKIISLDRRIQATTGLGYQFYDEDDLSLEVTFGPGYQNEKYEDEDAENSMTANWTLDYEQSFYEDFFRLYHDHDLTSPTDDFSAWLFESDSGVKIPLKNGIIASGEVEYDWNNNPAIGEEEEDTTYSVKLGYEW